MKNLFYMLLVLLIGQGITGCSLTKKSITEKPEEHAATTSQVEETSFISVSPAIDIPNLEKAVNKVAPSEYKGGGKEDWNHQTWLKTKGLPSCSISWSGTKCKDTWIKTKGPRVTVGYRYDYSIKRNGAVKVTDNRNNIRFTLPLALKGNAGARGDLAKFFSLNKKNFKADLDVYVDVYPSVNEEWCPTLNVKVTHKWRSKPSIEIVSGHWAPLTLPAELAMPTLKKDAEKYIRESIDCNELKEQVAETWKTYSIPATKINGNEYFVNVIPEAASWYGVNINGKKIEVPISIQAKTSISDFEQISQNINLPALKKTPLPNNKFNLSLPINVKYQDISDLVLAELKGGKFEEYREGGYHKLDVKGVRAFPVGSKVGLQVDISGKIPGRVLDVNGSFYVMGEPKINSLNILHFENIGFSAILDNEIWTSLLSLFDEQIIEALGNASKIDMNAKLSETQDMIHKAVESKVAAVEKAKFKVSKPIISISRLTPSQSELVVMSQVSGDVSIELLK